MYPALAVHDVLTSKVPDVKTLWVGGEGGIEESLVKRHGIPFQSIPAAGVHGVSPLVLPRNLFMLARGVLASYGIINDFKPDVLFFTGGYVAAPMAFAGRSVPGHPLSATLAVDEKFDEIVPNARDLTSEPVMAVDRVEACCGFGGEDSGNRGTHLARGV